MKYRLYGRDGITHREFSKLVSWGIIKKMNLEFHHRVKVKKRVLKRRLNSEGRSSTYSTEKSGSGDSAYTIETLYHYEENESGDPFK